MAGNSQRRGAIRKTGTKKGAVKGSGGQVSKSRESRGATPPAEVRTGHVAGRRAAAAKKGATFGRTAGGTSRGGRDAEGAAGSGGRSSGGSADRGASRGNDGGASRGYDGGARRGSGSGSGGASRGSGRVAGMRNPRVTGGGTMRRGKGLPETVVGRNPVVESLRAGVPATALYLAAGLQPDERITEVVQLAASAGIALMEISRHDLDKLTAGAIHQGVALAVPPYKYADPRDLLELAAQSDQPALIVAIDGVTDPRNLGAIVRSAAAFGANGVVVPERRSAGMTASAWRTSAGTAARIPIAQCTNLVRTLGEYAAAGLMIAGLDADGTVDTDSFDLATGPLVVVVGSEGRGLARLTRERCDVTVSVPMVREVESLNASVATGVVLAEVARRRRAE